MEEVMSHAEYIGDGEALSVLKSERDMLRKELDEANKKLNTLMKGRDSFDVVSVLENHAKKGLGITLSRGEYVTPQEIMVLCVKLRGAI